MRKKKDFDKWNEKKKLLNSREAQIFFKERELWWCKFGVNIGYEQDGGGEFLRPILIVKKFDNNTFVAVPLTKSRKKHKLRVELGLVLGKEAKANISQIRVCDKRRLLKKISTLERVKFNLIKQAVRELFK